MIKLRKIYVQIALLIYCIIPCVFSLQQDPNDLKFIKSKGYILDLDHLEEDEQKLQALLNKTKSEIDNEKHKLFKVQERYIQIYDKTVTYPDPNDNETVIQLLAMSRNAYVSVDSSDWYDITKYGWKSIIPFGWNSDSDEETANGVRGYAFVDDDRKYVTISVKGTSAGIFGIGGPTAEKDRLNDNMMFSCCCSNINRGYKPICKCYDDSINHICDGECVENKSKNYKYSYFKQIKKIYKRIQKYHKDYNIWFTGHSLGGAIASLLAINYNSSAITFEAPGEALFASRLGIQPDPEYYSTLPIYHFGNTGDPIFLGKCTGITSACYYSGFAMETKCHVGNTYTFVLNEENDPGNDDGTLPDDPNDNIPSQSINEEVISSPTPNRRKSGLYDNQLYINLNKEDEKRGHQENESYYGNEEDEDGMYDEDDEYYSSNNNKEKRFNFNPVPVKLNMLHHRIDYVIKLIKTWEGDWPEMETQSDCEDCEEWTFTRPLQESN